MDCVFQEAFDSFWLNTQRCFFFGLGLTVFCIKIESSWISCDVFRRSPRFVSIKMAIALGRVFSSLTVPGNHYPPN